MTHQATKSRFQDFEDEPVRHAFAAAAVVPDHDIEEDASQRPLAFPATAPTGITTGTQTPRMVKVAPGDGARLWQECLQGDYICIGWDGFGDLRQYPDQTAFKVAFAQTNPNTEETAGPLSQSAR